MKIELDTRPSETKVIDSKLLEYSKPSEVIRLKTKVDRGNIDVASIIIADCLNLKVSEKELYHAMINILNGKVGNQDNVNINIVIAKCITLYDKDRVTYTRAINSLVTKGVIKYSKDKTSIIINREYNTSTINYSQVKSIVINLV